MRLVIINMNKITTDGNHSDGGGNRFNDDNDGEYFSIIHNSFH